MKTHFDQYTNIRRLMFEKRPKLVVECGAGNGECTMLLAHMLDNYPFELHAISDKKIEGMDARIQWKVGLSYKILKDYKKESIGMCLIDTDHNFWTLIQELEAVADNMAEGGLIILHDVEQFYHDTGMAMSYWDDQPYPAEEIEAHAKFGSLGDAMIRFLAFNNNRFKLLSYDRNSAGCAVIEKKTVSETQIVRPGTKPMFAKPYDPKKEGVAA